MHSLVIGYGNDLRADDGGGRVVADRIEALGLPDVEVRSVSQLTPELALLITEVDQVIFVDASVTTAETTMEAVTPRPPGSRPMTHYADPATLLGMAATVGAIPEQAFLISIPASNLELGFDLSPATTEGVNQAVAMAKSRLISK